MSARQVQRTLQPRHVFHAQDCVWVVDETQPVAALFDPYTLQFGGLASWAELPAAPTGRRPPNIYADDGGLWVQNHPGGPLARVTTASIVRAEYTDGRTLLGAGRSGAWCFVVHARRRPGLAHTEDTPPPPFPRASFLVALPDGGTRIVPVIDAGVVSVEADDDHLHIGLEHHPWSRTPAADPPSDRPRYEAVFAKSVLSIPLHGPIPARIEPGTAHLGTHLAVGHTSEYADQTYNEAHHRKRSVDGDLRWHWGLNGRNSHNTVITTYRRDTVAATTEWTGIRVVDGAAAGGRLWAITSPGENGVRGVTVVDTSGELTVVPAGDIDITDRCRPLGTEPLDHESYVRHCLTQIGAMSISADIADVTASYTGAWPHGHVQVSFRHADYAGLTLIARCNIYDENGQRLDSAPSYIADLLAEQAAMRSYPPPERAIDSVLWV